MEMSERMTHEKGGGYNLLPRRPIFADRETVYSLLGIPEGTLRQLARDLVVACHKLDDTRQAKTVYFFEDCERWVKEQKSPEWVLAAQG